MIWYHIMVSRYDIISLYVNYWSHMCFQVLCIFSQTSIYFLHIFEAVLIHFLVCLNQNFTCLTCFDDVWGVENLDFPNLIYSSYTFDVNQDIGLVGYVTVSHVEFYHIRAFKQILASESSIVFSSFIVRSIDSLSLYDIRQ